MTQKAVGNKRQHVNQELSMGTHARNKESGVMGRNETTSLKISGEMSLKYDSEWWPGECKMNYLKKRQ